MELNREQIVNALEEWIKRYKSNYYREHAANALALIRELTEENERLRANNLTFARGVEKVAANYYNLGCTDTVRKMLERLCEGRVSNDNVVIVANQIAKEMLEEVNDV